MSISCPKTLIFDGRRFMVLLYANRKNMGVKNSKLFSQAQIIEDLHRKWEPHEGQVPIGKALFYENKKLVFLQCGRKFGKTEFTNYSCWRFALTHPGAAVYYIAPFQNQARELIWANRRLQYFLDESLHEKYQVSINNQEMRIKIGYNGSFIKLDGADNYEKHRGTNPHFIAYDEFKDHHPKFHEGMEPNLATFEAPLLIVGTPPETEDNLYCYMGKEAQDEEDGAYFHRPTHDNPHIKKEYLEKIKRRLENRGEWDVWQREYLANVVKGGHNAIFPMFDREKHVRCDRELRQEVERTRKNWNYYVSFDPGTASCFAVLFVAIHKYTKQVYILDEIYEKNMRETSTRKIFPRAIEKWRAINVRDDSWTLTYDYAATWFYNEVVNEFGYGIMPCQKDLRKKEDKLSLIKDMYLADLIKVSDNCKNFIFETENYIRDDKGKIPKENDHLLDNFRYILNAGNVHTLPAEEPDKPWDFEIEDRRAYRIENDPSLITDPFERIIREYYD